MIVVDSNTLLAVIRASGAAAPGTRELTLRQGPATYRRADALSVQANVAANITTSLLTLTSPTSPDTGTPGLTTFTLTASGLPAGTLPADQLRLLLEPALDATASPAITLSPASVSADTNGQRSITFQVPSTFTVAVAVLISNVPEK